MFEKSNKYIVLSRKEIFLVDATLERQKAEKISYSETDVDLDKIFAKIKVFAEGRNLGLLITDDLVYVFSSRIKYVDDSGKEIDENFLVESKIRSKIPEDLSKVVWDFKSKKLDSEYRLFQIAVTNPFTTEFILGLNKHDFSIDFVEPLSYSLARNTADKDSLHIIISANLFQKCILIADGGYVHFAATFTPNDFYSELEEVLNYAESHYSYDKARKGKIPVYISDKENASLNVKIPDAFKDTYELDILTINIFNTDIVLSKEHHGKQDDVLNVVPKNETNKFARMMHSMPVGKIEKSNYKLLGMIGLLILLIVVTAVVIINRNNAQSSTQNQISEVNIVDTTAQDNVVENTEEANQENSATDNPNDEAVGTDSQNTTDEQNNQTQTNQPNPNDSENVELTTEFSPYNLLILNGSGFPGDASRVDQLFITAGFSGGDLGNYPSGTVEKTTIRTKASIPSNVLAKTADVLAQFDLAYSEDFLDESSPYDIEIVIGETRDEN